MIELYQPVLIYPGLEYKAHGFKDIDDPVIGIITYINKEHKYFLVKFNFGGISLNACYKMYDPDELCNNNIHDICNYIRSITKTANRGF